MNDPLVNALANEFNRCVKSNTKESIKKSFKAAEKYLTDDPKPIPISSSTSDVVVAFNNILQFKKQIKTIFPLISAVCNIVSKGYVVGTALPSILSVLEGCIVYLEPLQVLRIVQCSMSISDCLFLQPATLQSVLSIIFFCCSIDDELVCTNASAAADSVIKKLVEMAFASDFVLDEDTMRGLVLSMSVIPSANFKDDVDPKQAYVTFIFKEIITLGNMEKPVWIRVESLPTSVTFSLLQMLTQNPPLYNLLSDAVDAAFKSDSNISFFINTFTECIVKSPSISSKIFNEFVALLKTKTKKTSKSLLFFRIALFQSPDVLQLFYQYCDPDGNFLSACVDTLRSLSDSYIGDYTISLKLSRLNEDSISRSDIMYTASVELAVFFVQTLYKADKISIKVLFEKTWSNLLNIITIASPYVDDNSIYTLVQAFHYSLILSYEHNVPDARVAVIGVLCKLLMDKPSTLRDASYGMVTAAIQTTPNAFGGHWAKIIYTMVKFEWIPKDAGFTRKLSDNLLVELCLALISVDTNSKNWPLSFLTVIIYSNNDRFELIWGAVEGYILLFFDDQSYFEASFNTYMELFTNNFNEQTEKYLFRTYEMLFSGRRKLPASYRARLLEQTHINLAHFGTSIKFGWSSLFNALSPSNFEDEKEILDLSFRCIQILCSDLIYHLDIETRIQATELFFQFTYQKTCINVALSSLELMWSVESSTRNDKMWQLILSKLRVLVLDSRNEVALCSIKTLFSIIMSNLRNFSQEIMDYILDECFIYILNAFSDDNEESYAAQQLAYYELAHCARLFWDKLSGYEFYRVEFWPKLIQCHEILYKNLTEQKKKELANSCIVFYEELLTVHLVKDQRDILFDSLEKIIHYTISTENANSSIYNSFNRMIRIILPRQKEMLDSYWLTRWIKVLDILMFELDSGTFLPPTAHKSFESLQSLFPLDHDMTIIVYNFLVKCAASNNPNKLKDVSLMHLLEMCENKVSSDIIPELFILSKELFHMNEARQLLLFFMEKDVPVSDGVVHDVYNTLTYLGEHEPELKEKTGCYCVRIFSRLDIESQNSFMEKYKSSPLTLMKFWSNYFEPDSSIFSEEISKRYIIQLLTNFGEILKTKLPEENLLEYITFISKSKTHDDMYNFQTRNSFGHLIFLLPVISEVALCNYKSVRMVVKDILLMVAKDAQHAIK